MKKHRWIKKGFCGLLVGLLLTQTVVIAKTEEPEGTKKGDLFIQEKLFSTDTKEVGSDKFEGSITVTLVISVDVMCNIGVYCCYKIKDW